MHPSLSTFVTLQGEAGEARQLQRHIILKGQSRVCPLHWEEARAHFSGIILLEESTARTRISVLRSRSTVGMAIDQKTQHQCLL